jgi:hypothetical protein
MRTTIDFVVILASHEAKFIVAESRKRGKPEKGVQITAVLILGRKSTFPEAGKPVVSLVLLVSEYPSG